MNKSVRHYVHYALMTCACSVLAAPAAIAQTAPAPNAPSQAAVNGPAAAPGQTDSAADQTLANTQQLSAVVITGTHILQSNAGAAQPIQAISANQILKSGFVTTTDVLQNMPQSGASLTFASQSFVSNGVAQTVNLRYLGSSRTLVMVNGKRWVPDITGPVNLNAIPTAMIQRIDVLQDGASAIYGSDAIAGVVNIITTNDFNGAEAHAYAGAYDNPGTGLDGRKYEYDFALGRSEDRWGIVVSGEYQSNSPVYEQNRYETRPGPFTQSTYLPGFVPPTLTIQSPALANQAIGGATCTKAGSCTLQVGAGPNFDPTSSNFTNQQFNTQYYPSQLMLTKQEQSESLYLNAHYRLAENLNFTALAAYNNDDSSGQIYSHWPAGVGGGGGENYLVNGAGYGIGANNPYNPFGVDLVGNSALYCPDGKTLGGVAVASCTPNYLLTQFNEPIPAGYDRISADDVNTYTLQLGLNGAFRAIGSDWHWTAGFNYGRIIDTAQNTGFTNIERLAEGLNSPGALPCNGPAQAAPGSTGTWDEINGKYYQILIPGCVPLNPFGGFDSVTGQSAITPDMVAWDQASPHFVRETRQHDFTADITGRLIQLPAGPLSVAAGAESLQVLGSFTAGDLLGQCLTSLRCQKSYFGQTSTDAEYLELNIPVVKDFPLAKSLTIDLANRWSQFTWQGGTPVPGTQVVKNSTSASTGRIQVRWQPIADLAIRASWAQGFRAPAITDLYNPGSAGYGNNNDPCAPAAQGGNWVPGTPLPPGCNGVAHTEAGKILTLAPGNPFLTPEKAISRSAGFVYSPSWISDLSFGADYYDIALTNAIGTPSSQYILNQCYNNNVAQDCNLITVSGGVITQIVNESQNIGGETTSGVDLHVDYSLGPTFLGTFSANTTWTIVRSFISQLPSATSSSGFVSVQELGYTTDNIPKIRGDLSLNWRKADWSAVWNIHYIGKVFENCSALTTQLHECSLPTTVYPPTGSVGEHELNRVIYNDAALTYDIEPIRTNVTLGIQNIFNQQFPLAYTSQSPPYFNGGMGYRIPGRFIYARIGARF